MRAHDGKVDRMVHIIFGLFLYFPEDKTEYIPAAISFTAFFIAAVLTMRVIVKVSKRQEEKAKQLEEQLQKQRIDD
jgi:flagellar biosynthesis/type III secretory pathway M-ring protein FliF/YscJ